MIIVIAKNLILKHKFKWPGGFSISVPNRQMTIGLIASSLLMVANAQHHDETMGLGHKLNPIKDQRGGIKIPGANVLSPELNNNEVFDKQRHGMPYSDEDENGLHDSRNTPALREPNGDDAEEEIIDLYGSPTTIERIIVLHEYGKVQDGGVLDTINWHSYDNSDVTLHLNGNDLEATSTFTDAQTEAFNITGHIITERPNVEYHIVCPACAEGQCGSDAVCILSKKVERNAFAASDEDNTDKAAEDSKEETGIIGSIQEEQSKRRRRSALSQVGSMLRGNIAKATYVMDGIRGEDIIDMNAPTFPRYPPGKSDAASLSGAFKENDCDFLSDGVGECCYEGDTNCYEGEDRENGCPCNESFDQYCGDTHSSVCDYSNAPHYSDWCQSQTCTYFLSCNDYLCCEPGTTGCSCESDSDCIDTNPDRILGSAPTCRNGVCACFEIGCRCTEKSHCTSGNCDSFRCAALDPSDPPDDCFSLESNVIVKDKGVTSIRDLRIGDMVLSDDRGTYSKFYSKGHYKEEGTTEFLRISTELTKKPLELTPTHMLFEASRKLPVPASSLQIGDLVETTNGPSEVTSIEKILREGLFNPLTLSGSIVVDDVVSSVHSEERGFEGIEAGWIHLDGRSIVHWHSLMHLIHAPHRIICGRFVACAERLDEDGQIPFYQFLMKLRQTVEEKESTVFSAGILLVIVAVMLPFWALDQLLEHYLIVLVGIWFMVGSWLVIRKVGFKKVKAKMG